MARPRITRSTRIRRHSDDLRLTTLEDTNQSLMQAGRSWGPSWFHLRPVYLCSTVYSNLIYQGEGRRCHVRSTYYGSICSYSASYWVIRSKIWYPGREADYRITPTIAGARWLVTTSSLRQRIVILSHQGLLCRPLTWSFRGVYMPRH